MSPSKVSQKSSMKKDKVVRRARSGREKKEKTRENLTKKGKKVWLSGTVIPSTTFSLCVGFAVFVFLSVVLGFSRFPVFLSQLLDLLCHHDGVLLPQPGRRRAPVVEGTVMLVRVAVDGAEQVAAATVEPWSGEGRGTERRQSFRKRLLNIEIGYNWLLNCEKTTLIGRVAVS